MYIEELKDILCYKAYLRPFDTIDRMIFEGHISYFNKRFSGGTIAVGHRRYRFNIADVLNYDPRKDCQGLKVQFRLREPVGDFKTATDIIIKYPNIRVNRKEVFNWEENETHHQPHKPDQVRQNQQSKKLPVPTTESKDFVALALLDRRIRLVSLNKDGEYSFLDKANLSHNIYYPSIFEEISLQIAIEELEELINSAKASENDFQRFFNKYPDFILNDEYKRAHSHIILEKQDKEKLIPDFILEPVNQNTFCDILELKLPTSEIFVLKKNRERFSAAVFEVAAQLREYSKYFDIEDNRKRFNQAYPHLKIYKPRMLVIIGRENHHSSMIKRDIQSTAPDLTLKTYDDIINRMKWKRQILSQRNSLIGKS